MKKNLEKLKKEYVGEVIELLDLEGIGEYSLDYIFPNNQVYNLGIGKHSEIMKGSHSCKIEEYELEEEDYFNFIFETVGKWEVVDNSAYSNIFLTKIDEESIEIKITDISII